jgi:hypothetical protein
LLAARDGDQGAEAEAWSKHCLRRLDATARLVDPLRGSRIVRQLGKRTGCPRDELAATVRALATENTSGAGLAERALE